MSIDPQAPFPLDPQRGLVERLTALARRVASLERRWGYEPSVFPGMIVQSATATVPPGYLACDGAAVSRTTYAALFAAIGTAYGAGDGSTTFNLPPHNNQNRFPRGAASPGATGGAATHQHDTGVNSATAVVNLGPQGTPTSPATFANQSHIHTTDAQSNLPPHVNVVFFVKT